MWVFCGSLSVTALSIQVYNQTADTLFLEQITQVYRQICYASCGFNIDIAPFLCGYWLVFAPFAKFLYQHVPVNKNRRVKVIKSDA